MFHPIDNAYNIKHGITGSLSSGFASFALLFAVFVLTQIGVGFIFSVPIEKFSIAQTFIYFSVVLGMFIVLHYYTAAINDGNGSPVEVFLCVGSGFAPCIIIMPFVILAANALTYNEYFIIQISFFVLLVWSVINIIAGLIEIHEYSFKEIAGVLLLTLFFMLVAILAATIFYNMLKQIYDFAAEIITEVGLRV